MNNDITTDQLAAHNSYEALLEMRKLNARISEMSARIDELERKLSHATHDAYGNPINRNSTQKGGNQ
jgi:division protein CdvB (Snf7/Vps24/ESCRT-III family)